VAETGFSFVLDLNKSNQIIYLDKQIQKKVDKMSNEKA